ncbi:MAG TPA: CPBP family intramembrane glutamic endopeptidase [Polyangiaceae bacterium]|jgi:hypothetical protein
MKPEFSFRAAFAWTALVTFGWELVAYGLVMHWPRIADSLVALGGVQVIVYGLVIAAIVRSLGVGPTAALGLRRAPLGVCALSALLGAVLQIPISAIDDAIERRWPTPAPILAERVARIIPHSLTQAVSITLIVAVLGPLVEELFFRGALFGGMVRSRGVRPTAIAVSACFVFAHMEINEALPLFLVALALAEVRAATGSLWPGFLLHGAFNGVTLALAFRGKLPGGQSAEIPARLAFVGTLVTGALGYLLLSLALASPLAQKARGEDLRPPSPPA